MDAKREIIGGDDSAIELFLEEEGHRCSLITKGCWRGRYRTPSRVLPYVIHADREKEVLNLAIVPFMSTPEDDSLAEALYTRLLELNQVLYMAKFSIDDDLDVVLSVSYPTADLQRSELRDGLSALFYYADNHHAELHRIVDPAG